MIWIIALIWYIIGVVSFISVVGSTKDVKIGDIFFAFVAGFFGFIMFLIRIFLRLEKRKFFDKIIIKRK